ncbi:hypothetical protein AUP68_08208 [Ilyonectria robusta]
MQPKLEDNVLLALRIQKLRKPGTMEESSGLVSLSAECSGAGLCIRPARASVFVIPTPSWLALERAQCKRK